MKYLYRNFLKIKYWIRFSSQVRFSLNKILWESGSPFSTLKPVALNEIFKEIDYSEDSLKINNFLTRQRGMSLELEELMTILTVIRKTNSKKILEIGTFDGNTALNMALNLPEEGKVVTIDLPPEGLEKETLTGRLQPVNFTRRQFNDTDQAKKIEQVYGDSAELNWDNLDGPFDLVLIDGDHSSQYALNDTHKALSVLESGGCILWHDYEMESVSKVIDSSLDNESKIFWIKGTRIALGIFDEPKKSIKNFQFIA